ncbi:MAG: aldo/keto reductase [Bacteroidia bacterium]|nr:aldo/keto reductase [Bacteroidia bacterium]
MNQSMVKYFELNNEIKIPAIGFGTWQIRDREAVIESVKTALSYGYRHIDTAAVYNNEKAIGEGIKISGIEREELFITSKVWNSERGYQTTINAFENSLNRLQLDYLDLYLIHWPATSNQFYNWQKINSETWKALEFLQSQGKIRSIGVSNFLKHHLEPLLDYATVKPAVNQIEYLPGYMQDDCVKYCQEQNIQIEGWSPLGRGKVFSNETLNEIAVKYNKSVAQICIRWALQNNVLPLPKSVTPIRIKENIDVFDFELSDSAMILIDQIDDIQSSGFHPDTVDF